MHERAVSWGDSSDHRYCAEAAGVLALAAVGVEPLVFDGAHVVTEVIDLYAKLAQLRDHPSANVERGSSPRGRRTGLRHRGRDSVSHFLGHLVAPSAGARSDPRFERLSTAVTDGTYGRQDDALHQPFATTVDDTGNRFVETDEHNRRAVSHAYQDTDSDLVGEQRINDRDLTCGDGVRPSDVSTVHLRHADETINSEVLAEQLKVALYEIGIVAIRRTEIERSPRAVAQTPVTVTEGEFDPTNRLAVKEHS